MKATGIVRRIDDLGRVVIPKEIRKVNGIQDGDPLEIYVGTDGEIILKKYELHKNVLEKITDLINYFDDNQDIPFSKQQTIVKLLEEAQKAFEFKE